MPASKDLLAEHNKRGTLEFDYVTSLNCDLALAAKCPSSILNPHLNAVREFPSNSRITLCNTMLFKKEIPLKWLH